MPRKHIFMHRYPWLAIAAAATMTACGAAEQPSKQPAPPAATSSASPAPKTPDELDREAWAAVQSARTLRNAGQAEAALQQAEKALGIWETLTGATASAVATFDDVAVRPSAEIKVIAASADGRVGAQAWGRSIAVFDAASWRLAELLDGHEAQVLSLAFSHDGTRLFSSAQDGTVRLWDVASARLLGTAGPMPAVSEVAMAPDGRKVAYRCGAHLCFWTTSESAPDSRQIRAPGGCLAVRHWLDDRTLVAGENGEELCFLDIATGAPSRAVPFMSGHLAFAPRSTTFLASVIMGSSVRVEVWNGTDATRKRSLSLDRPDGKGKIGIQGPPALSPDGKQIAAPTSLREVTWWNAETGAVERQTSTRVPVGNPVYLADGRLVLPHIRGRGFDIMAAGNLEPIPAFSLPSLADAELSSPRDGALLMVRVGTRLVPWSLKTGAPADWPSAGDNPAPSGIRCTASAGALLAIPSGNEVLVRAAGDGQERLRRQLPAGRVMTAVGFAQGSPSLIVVSSEVAASGPGKKASGWVEVAPVDGSPSTQPARRIDAHLGAQLSENGKVLATVVSGKGVRMWELPAAQAKRTIAVAGPWALSPDGASIAWVGRPAGGKDQPDALRIVQTATGTERVLADVPLPRGNVAWRSDGQVIVYASPRAEGGVEMVSVDVGTGRVAWKSPLPGAAGISDIVMTSEGRLVFGRDKTGRIHVLSGTDGRFLLSWGIASDGRSWFATNAEGKLETGGPEGDSMIACKVGMRVLPFEVCRHRVGIEGMLTGVLRGP